MDRLKENSNSSNQPKKAPLKQTHLYSFVTSQKKEDQALPTKKVKQQTQGKHFLEASLKNALQDSIRENDEVLPLSNSLAPRHGDPVGGHCG